MQRAPLPLAQRCRGQSLPNDVRPRSDSDTRRMIASPWHTLVVLVVQGFLSYRGMVRAAHMRVATSPDHIGLYERTMLFEWLMLGLVLIGVYLHGSSLLTVMGERWRSASQILRDLGIAIAFLIVTITITSVAGGHGGEGENAARFLLPNGRREIAVWIALSITAGICEEALYRGYLQRQFMALTGSVPAGIILSAIAFGAAHSYQGWRQAVQIGVLGAMGGILAYWCKSVRPGMIAHALQDVLGGLIRH